MKFKSTLLVALAGFFILFSQAAKAQKTEVQKFKLKEGQRLELDLKFADNITMKPWNRNEVVVKAFVKINEGFDDDKFELKTYPTENGIKVVSQMPASLVSYLQAYFNPGDKGSYRGVSYEISYVVNYPKHIKLQNGQALSSAQNEKGTAHADYLAALLKEFQGIE
jgi:hypothetical protein